MTGSFTNDELPAGFSYPPEFLRLVRLGLVNFEPWSVLTGDRLRIWSKAVASRYPARSLVPFAIRNDNDDVACWDLDRGGVVSVIDYGDTQGLEQMRVLQSTHEWLRLAVEDLIEYDI